MTDDLRPDEPGHVGAAVTVAEYPAVSGGFNGRESVPVRSGEVKATCPLMHHAFDTWKAREFPYVPFERLVDNVITHCVSEQAATAIRQQVRRMRFHLHSDLSFNDIARMINAKAGPWAAYYGRFRPSEAAEVLFHVDWYRVRWARRKDKHLRTASRRAWRTLAQIRKIRPGLLAHWRWDVRTRTAVARAGWQEPHLTPGSARAGG